MLTPQEQLNEMVRRHRWYLVGLWCFGLGVLVLVAAIITLGFGGIGNPKSASSVFSAFALAGLLRPFAWPLTIFGVGAVAAGIIVCTVASGKSHEPRIQNTE